MIKIKVVFIGILIVCVSADSLAAQEYSSAARDYIGLFSGSLRSSCPMYPSCSRYGMMVFEDYPFPVAMAMMSDRMLRCGNHPDFYPSLTTADGSAQMLDFPPTRYETGVQLCATLHDVAAETIVPKDSVSKALQFINHLVNQHCYASALLEIDRLLYFDTSFLYEPALYINKMRCLEGLQQYSDGLLFYEQNIPGQIKSNYKIMYTAAHLYDLVGDYTRAIDVFAMSALCWDSNEVNPFGELAVLYAKVSLYDEARASLERKLAVDGDVKAFAASNLVLAEQESAKRKDPTAAMLLGIVPGAGYLYAGQSGSALTALLTNGLLAYATYTSFKTKNIGLGILTGLFSASFYIGNIAGSGRSAERYNDKIKRDAIGKLRQIIPFYY